MPSKIKNLGRAKLKIKLLSVSMVKVLAKSLNEEAEDIMSDSKENYVPVDQGPLRNSGSVDNPVIEGSSAKVTLGYGNQAADYALIVHEDLIANHPVGQAKYLEEPFNLAQVGMAKRISKDLRKAARRLT